MTNVPLDIDRVVREVIAELQRAPATKDCSAAETKAEQKERPANATPTAGELVLSARLVTMEEIAGRLDGIRRVTVDPRAVVTPAVRDALRQRNIDLSRVSPAKNVSAVMPKLVVVVARCKTDPKPLADALRNEGVEVKCEATDCVIAAADRLAAEIAKGDTLGLMLTPHVSAALCLANRLAGIRAVTAGNESPLEAVLNAVGANLLIVDPHNTGLFKLTRIAGEFVRGGMRQCPEVFKKRLM